MKKTYILFAFVLLLALITSGCGAQENTDSSATQTTSSSSSESSSDSNTTVKGRVMHLIISTHDSYNTLTEVTSGIVNYLAGDSSVTESDLEQMKEKLAQVQSTMSSDITELQTMDMSTIPEPALTDVKNYTNALINYIDCNSKFCSELKDGNVPSDATTAAYTESMTKVHDCFLAVGLSITD